MSDDLYVALAEYEDTSERPGGAELRNLVSRYPQHAHEIVEYALEDCLVREGAECTPETEIEAMLLARAAAVRNRLRAASIPGLLELAKQRGLSPAALSRSLGLGLALLTKLDRRLVRAASIPSALVERLAESLGRSREELAAYLRQPPRLSAQASYRAHAAPRVEGIEDFSDALESCPGITDDTRAYWRAEAERPLGGAG